MTSLLPLRCHAFAERLVPFLAAGVLDAPSAHVADELGAMAGVVDPDVLLACALAIRAPRHGHVGADLRRPPAVEPSDEHPEPAELPWPAHWPDAPALVRQGDEARETPFVRSGQMLYLDRYWTYQRCLAARLDLLAASATEPHDSQLLATQLAALSSLGPRQRLAARQALRRRLSVVSGGPGTGKTTTVRSILALLYGQSMAATGQPPSVALAAPTGKAAARLTEALREGLDGWSTDVGLRAFIASLEGRTVHRLLGYQYRSPTRPVHHDGNPLPQSAVIVDEASMIDLALMARLVDAVGSTSRLLLLGDANQLVSVEAGTVLADIVGPLTLDHEAAPGDAGLASCVTLLDHNYRFTEDSGVGQFARACLRHDIPAARRALGDAFADTLRLDHVAEGSRELVGPAARDAIVAGYGAYLQTVFSDLRRSASPASWEACAARALAQLEQFRVLCAHRGGLHGVGSLNAYIERLLAGQGTFTGRSRYRPTASHYAGRPLLIRENAYDLNLFNGDTGILVPDPDAPDGGGLTAIFATPNGVRRLHPARLPVHETCYATTIHKSQGSQHAHTLTILPRRASPLLTRNLVYTAVTRTQVGQGAPTLPGVPARAILIASDDVLDLALQTEVTRASGLRGLLWPQESDGG